MRNRVLCECALGRARALLAGASAVSSARVRLPPHDLSHSDRRSGAASSPGAAPALSPLSASLSLLPEDDDDDEEEELEDEDEESLLRLFFRFCVGKQRGGEGQAAVRHSPDQPEQLRGVRLLGTLSVCHAL